MKAAKVLVEHGADLNSKAGTDENGFGGQTPVFHTVNQHNNACLDMLKYLLDQKANLDITVKGLKMCIRDSSGPAHIQIGQKGSTFL